MNGELKKKKEAYYLHFLLIRKDHVLCLRTREGSEPSSSG